MIKLFLYIGILIIFCYIMDYLYIKSKESFKGLINGGSKMLKTGNLFKLAEEQLIYEKNNGIIPCYTMLDIIDYAVRIRKYLDNPKKRIKLTTKQKKENNKKCRRLYYKKTGR